MLAEIVIAHGERAVVRVGDVFVKADTVRDRVERELAALRSVPVPVPEVLWHRPGPVQVLALAEVLGTPLSAVPAARAWSAAGQIARRLHDHPVPHNGPLAQPSRYRLEALDQLEQWVIANTSLDRAVVAEHAGWARRAWEGDSDDSLVHGDFQPAHLLFSPDGSLAGVIDWGDAGLGDRHYDLAVLTVEHPEFLGAVLDGYGRDVDRQRISGYWSFRRLGSIRWMTEHGFDASADINGLKERPTKSPI